MLSFKRSGILSGSVTTVPSCEVSLSLVESLVCSIWCWSESDCGLAGSRALLWGILRSSVVGGSMYWVSWGSIVPSDSGIIVGYLGRGDFPSQILAGGFVPSFR